MKDLEDTTSSGKAQKLGRRKGGKGKKKPSKLKTTAVVSDSPVGLEQIAEIQQLEGDATSADQAVQTKPLSEIAMLRKRRKVQLMSVSRHRKHQRNYDLYREMEKRRELVTKEALEEQIITAPSRFERHHKGTNQYINVSDLTMTVGGSVLLDHGDLKLVPGHRYGLVGKNGVGKSTLFNRINRGLVQNFPSHISTLHVEQEIKGDDQTALQAVIGGNREKIQLLAEEALLLSMSEKGITYDEDTGMTVDAMLKEVYELLANTNSSDDEALASKILSGLGFDETTKNTPTKLLSGGWRMKVALAQSLLIQPDLLMLDEPTNHLDLAAIMWLQSYLVNELDEECILIMVSHDRVFLDNVITDIIVMAKKNLFYHPECNFSQFLKKMDDQRRFFENEYEYQQKKKKHLEESIRKMKSAAKTHSHGDKGSALSSAASKQKAIERLGMEKTMDGKKWKRGIMGDRIKINPERPEKPLVIKFPTPLPLRQSSTPLFAASSISFKYGDRVLIKDFSCSIEMNSRLILLGKNGAGKTTLIKVIEGSLNPTSGTCTRHNELSIAHYHQHMYTHPDDPEDTDNLVERLVRINNGKFQDLNETDYRKYLGSFGLSGKVAQRPIKVLSGGQKARFSLACMFWFKPNLVIFDEVSNHLDFDSILGIEQAIAHFDGAMILVSHDQHLVSSTIQSAWNVPNQNPSEDPEKQDEYVKNRPVQIMVVGGKGGNVVNMDSRTGYDEYVQIIKNRVEQERLKNQKN